MIAGLYGGTAILIVWFRNRCRMMMRAVIGIHCCSNGCANSSTNNGAVASTHLVADRRTSSAADAATNGGIQGGIIGTGLYGNQ